MSDQSTEDDVDQIPIPVCPDCRSENFGGLFEGDGKSLCNDCGAEFWGAEVKHDE